MTALTVDVLGRSNAWAAPGEATSGYLVRGAGTEILLDCGHGVLARLRETADPFRLDAVWLSHLHADHCADVLALGYMLRFHPDPRQGHRPRLIVPAGENERLRRIADAHGNPDTYHEAFDVEEVADGQTVIVGGLTLEAGLVPHPLPTMAVDVRVTGAPEARVTYGADCGPNTRLVELAAGSPLLLVEATLPEADDMHLSATAAARIAASAHAGLCMLVHTCDAYDLEQVAQAAGEVFPGPVQVARAGMTVTVGR